MPQMHLRLTHMKGNVHVAPKAHRLECVDGVLHPTAETERVGFLIFIQLAQDRLLPPRLLMLRLLRLYCDSVPQGLGEDSHQFMPCALDQKAFRC